MDKVTNKSADRRVYLDHAAATPVDSLVVKSMLPYLNEEFGNAGALYREGRHVKEAMENARKSVAVSFNASPDEIIFTSGGTEGDNTALFGVARAVANISAGARGKGHIITTAIEHHAVLHACRVLEKEGFDISYIGVDKNGIVKMNELKSAFRSDTVLVSVMYANNEIGTIQPISQIAKIVRHAKGANAVPYFHTDACQAAGYLDIDVKKLGVDLMVINGSKIYGPKGAGVLYIKRGVRMQPLLYGGAQEGKKRAGTENIAGIVGITKALEIACEKRKEESSRLGKLRDYMIKRILDAIPKTVLNGDSSLRLPNNVNISILNIEGEAMVLYLDAHGIACSTGSACTSESLDPSHVILALGRPYEHAHASIRFTLGRSTTRADIDRTLKVLPRVVETLRKVSPLNTDIDETEMSHPEAFAGQGLKVRADGKTYK